MPVTEYEALETGLTLNAPPVMLNVEMPTAAGVITTELPKQIEALFTVIVGVVLTDTEATAVLELTQPFVLVPVTE